MKSLLTSDLKVKFLGITPVLNDRTGILNPQEIVALSSQATFKGKSIKELLKEIEKSGENLKDRVRKTLMRSSLRGHASLSTTPAISLTYEGSKFLDSALTGIYFSSSLMASGRRTQTTEKDIIFPTGIFKNKKAKEIYEKVSKNIIQTYNYFLSKGVKKDEASKILQYGIYGTGIVNLPLETVVGLKREYLAEKEWMPEEVGILLKKIERALKKYGVDLLYATRQVAPRNVYPYPNIFKDPKKTNLVRELREKERPKDGFKLISLEFLNSSNLRKKAEELARKKRKTFSSLGKIKKEWLNILSLYREIFRDYNLSLKLRVLSSIPWRIWGEKKRHRTCPQIIESIYYCLGRAAKNPEEFLSIPPTIKKNPEYLSKYLSVARGAFGAYKKLLELGIKPREAIFLIPRAVKIDILQDYDLYNLLTGYYPLRLCSTAEEEMFRNTWQEIIPIKKALKEKGAEFLNKFIVPKCQIMGFCPEEKMCNLILPAVKDYNEKFHQEMKEELKRLMEENLKNLGK